MCLNWSSPTTIESDDIPLIAVDIRTRKTGPVPYPPGYYAGLTISNDRNRLLPENAEEFIFLRVAWSKVDSLKRKREVT